MMKVALVTCYKEPDYVRARTIRAAVKRLPNVHPVIVKNKHLGVLRYTEIAAKLVITRFKYKPDVYLLTFRAYEILPLALLVCIGKPVIYDEFINPIEWLVYEHHKIRRGGLPHRLFAALYRWLVAKTTFILADTAEHAGFSSQLNRIDKNKYYAIPVGADEALFKPADTKKVTKAPFRVFFYGNMRPLHGIDYVLKATQLLDSHEYAFYIVGGDNKVERAVADVSASTGTSITYTRRIPFDQIARQMHETDIFLGGPFGGTTQARYVISGKTTQALAAGVPTIVGKNRVTKLFIDQQNCLLVDQANPKSLANAIIWAQTHRKELSKIALSGRRLYEKEFSVDKISRLLAEVFEKVA